MNRVRRSCGCLAGLARCAGALPGYGGAMAAALAGARPDPPWWLRYHWHLPPRARAHPVVSGSLPGWQITLIAAAALLAAAIAVTRVPEAGGAAAHHSKRRQAHRRPGGNTPPRSRQWKTG